MILKKKVKVNVVKTKVFKDEVHFSLGKLGAFLLIFAAIGGFFLWRTLAAQPLVQSVEAESLTIDGGAKTFRAKQTSSGTGVYMPIGGRAIGFVNIPTNATKITVSARGKVCSGDPRMQVDIDGKQAMSVTVDRSSWAPFSTVVDIAPGTHSLSIKLVGQLSTVKNCENKLFVDYANFYGPEPVVIPAPTIAFSASPTSVDAGASSTLTWKTTNATSCTASGTWTGAQPTSGSTNTGALNSNSTYNLDCQGSGGIVKASVSISIINKTSAPATPTLPKQGVSTGYKIFNRSATDRAFELDKIKRMFNGKPGFVRLDDTTGNQTQLATTITDVMNRGMTPFLTLHGTTGPRSVDTFGRDQAIKWNGKTSFFEIANEPDLNGWTPDSYADFAKGTGQSIKSGNPNAVVIAGALFSGGSSGYTTQDYCRALATRAKGTFDMVSLHLYDDPTSRGTWSMWDRAFPTILGTTSTYKGNTCREILDANGLSNVPIISTESGGPVYKYGDSGQSTIVGHDFDALKSNLLPSMIVYTMMNDDVPGFGLLDDNKNERPAYVTFMSRAY